MSSFKAVYFISCGIQFIYGTQQLPDTIASSLGIAQATRNLWMGDWTIKINR